MNKMKKHRKHWFTNRIGKRIYRLTKMNCCKICDHVEASGLKVDNNMHAEYLYDCQDEMELIYSDTLKLT